MGIENGNQPPKGVDKIINRYETRLRQTGRDHGRDFHAARGEIKAITPNTGPERSQALNRLMVIQRRRGG